MIKDTLGSYNPDAVVAATANDDGSTRLHFGGQSFLDISTLYDKYTQNFKPLPAQKTAPVAQPRGSVQLDDEGNPVDSST
jgi:hypothetical protein